MIKKNNTFSASNPILVLTIVGLFALGISACEQSAFPDGIPPCERSVELSEFEMVWNDEFEGNEVDTTKWSFQLGDGCDIQPKSCGAFEETAPNLCQWGNFEKQYYTDRPQNVKVENGNLVITARKEPQPFRGYDYTSTRMRTLGKGDWKYARIDVRANVPVGQGLWAAAWMLSSEEKFGGWPCSGEIDIMEHIGSKPFETISTLHFGNEFWRFITQSYEKNGTDFTQGFHVYSVIWDESCIRFMVDGELFGSPLTPSSTLPQTYPFQEKFHMILNVAVGGNLPGDPTPATVFPQSMEVDYVRVYQRK